MRLILWVFGRVALAVARRRVMRILMTDDRAARPVAFERNPVG